MMEYDSLTGVLTRASFCRRAEEYIRNNSELQFDIVLSDFVNFKHFNERYGIEKGDLLLAKAGEMLRSMGPDMICGRFGADRFVVLAPRLGDTAITFLENFRLPEEAKEFLPVESVVVKFGICRIPDASVPVSVYCDHAYTAVQSVKHQYGRNVAVYDENKGEEILQQLIIEENMQQALEKQEFVVCYQPKMDLATGKICGAEALVRWVHPIYGYMNPGLFIPLFEKNGFITSMDFYVWERVCRDLAEWKAKGMTVVPVSANVSRKDFNQKELSENIIATADRFGVEHELLHIEVTESTYAEDPESVVKHINALHDAGFQIELDDFGAGYTSLSSLNDLKIDILKLDMSLLQKDKPDSDRSVLTFAVQLAKMMKLQTIQEGVEAAEQVERVKALGCDYIQGYYYSKPLGKDEFEQFVNL